MDGAIARRVAALALDGATDVRVLEIGAGTGVLTAALAVAGARVTALEIDPDLVAVLRARDDLGDADIREVDAMRFDLAAFGGDAPWRVAANLPYNIGTPLVAELATLEQPPERIVAMLQKDVVDRLVARPSTPAYGALGVVVSYAMDVTRAFTIGPSHFHPRPNVDSSVVVLTRRERPRVDVADREALFKVVHQAFAYRRKTLANSLSLATGIPRATLAATLTSVNVDPEARAESLDLGAFAAVANALAV